MQFLCLLNYVLQVQVIYDLYWFYRGCWLQNLAWSALSRSYIGPFSFESSVLILHMVQFILQRNHPLSVAISLLLNQVDSLLKTLSILHLRYLSRFLQLIIRRLYLVQLSDQIVNLMNLLIELPFENSILMPCMEKLSLNIFGFF